MRFVNMHINLLLATIILTCCIHQSTSSDCSPSSGQIKCNCDAVTIECTGTQTDILDVQNILMNVSSMEKVILEIKDLKFDPDFKFENMSFKNVTLGYALETPPPDFLSGLSTTLVSLNLKNNSIQHIDDKLFFSATDLKEINLDLNEVNILQKNMFINLRSLEFFSIASNDFDAISPDTFEHLPVFKTLVLSHNNISLMENIQIKSSSLSTLNIEDCLIQGSLDKDTFLELPNLEYLDISHNKLSEMKPNSLSSLKKLLFLNVSYNVIEFLRENAFSELKNLTSLDLKNNKISLIARTSFSGLESLKFLDLSGNKLKAILCDYTSDFIALERIYLENNEIKSFTTGAFFYSPYLQELNLSGNTLECSCELTETVHYLIENSTMKSEDFSSIMCVIPSAATQISVTDYKSSKCIPEEPCKKVTHDSSDEDYDYDYEDDNTTTVSHTNDTSSTFIPLTNVPSTSVSISTDVSTESITPAHTTIEITSHSSTVSHTNDTSSTFIPLTNVPSTSVSISTDVFTESITPAHTTIEIRSHSSTEKLTSFATDTSTALVSETSTQSSTVYSTITPNSTTTNFSTTATPLLVINDTSTTDFVNVTTLLPNTTTSYATTNSLTYSSSTISSTALVGNTTVALTSTDTCSSTELFIEATDTDTELMIIKNFSYDGNMFCLKWTLGGPVTGVQRCIIKYTYIGGVKSQNIECPTFKNDIKIWSKNENVYKFCLKVYAGKIMDSCAKVSEKTTSLDPGLITISSELLPTTLSSNITSELATLKIQTSTQVVGSTSENYTISITTANEENSYSESTTNKYHSSSEKSSTLSPETATESTIFLPVTQIITSAAFNVTSLLVLFNDSSFAYVKWTVNIEQSRSVCNLTLTATTQYFDHQEGIFPCKNNIVRLESVKDDELFKVCLIIFHKITGYSTVCKYSLSDTPVDASASKGTEKTSHNSSMIPLICLLVLLVLIVIFIILKNTFKKKAESDKYDVRAEEEKSEKVRIRSSTHEQSSVRYSYLAKQNEYI